MKPFRRLVPPGCSSSAGPEYITIQVVGDAVRSLIPLRNFSHGDSILICWNLGRSQDAVHVSQAIKDECNMPVPE